MRRAAAQSPALALLAHRVRALVHAGRAEGALPSAELGLEVMNLPLLRPYALGDADAYVLQLQQRFPAPGALDARARARAEEARALLAELLAEERLVRERADTAFTDYALATAQRQLEARQLTLLEQMGQAVRARFTTGGAGLGDAARLEVERAKVGRSLARLEGEQARARATLNAVLRRAPGAPLGEPPAPRAVTVRLSLDALLARAREHRGGQVSADARLRAATARRHAAEAEARQPELMVGAGYWQAPAMRPGVGLSASMTLPWLWGPQGHQLAQAREEEAAERATRDGMSLEAQAEIAGGLAQLGALEAQLGVVRARGLPMARRSLDALSATYATGGVSLLDWVDASRSLLDLERELLDLRGALERGVASLERAVGAPLLRTPIPEDQAP